MTLVLKRCLVIGVLAAAALMLAGRPAQAGTLNVVATLPDLGAIATAVGGANADVAVLAPATKDPHQLPAKPSYMLTMNKADLLVYNGLDLEVGWLPKLLEGSRNPAVLPGKSGNLDASQYIPKVLEKPDSLNLVSRALGDVHPFGNPHYSRDPHTAAPIAHAIADRMAQLDPAHAETYRTNAASFDAKLQSRLAIWEQQAAALKGAKIVSYHRDFPYLADWLGFEVVDELEPKPGIPPTPGHLKDLQAAMSAGKVRMIVTLTWHPTTPVESLSQRTGAKVVVLPGAVGGTPEAHDFFSYYDTIVAKLAEGAR